MTVCVLLILAVWLWALWPTVKQHLPVTDITGVEYDLMSDLED